MYKCIKAFKTGIRIFNYGIPISFYDYKNLSASEQKNFVMEIEADDEIIPLPIYEPPPDTGDANEFQGFSEGGGASGEY